MFKTILKLDQKSVNQAIIMQQIVFKRDFSFVIEAIRNKNVQLLEKKIQLLKRLL